MKKVNAVLGMIALVAMVAFSSCKKDECHECHYDGPNDEEVELGEKCGDDLEDLEASGYNVDGQNYVVHCNEH